MIGYDNIPENEDILLDLPFYEGTGVLTRDQAKPHHQDITLRDPGGGSFAWTTLASGLMVLEFITIGGGVTDGVYIDLASANCADLDFTTGDYSAGGWVKWAHGETSQILLGRYVLDTNGWEIYLTEYGGLLSLTHRHHHSGGSAARTSNNSVGWTQDVWCLWGISRSGVSSAHYKNGVSLPVTGSLEDPETCAQDLVIGCRYSKNANWLKGQIWDMRVWNRALTAAEWLIIFEKERAWFGV